MAKDYIYTLDVDTFDHSSDVEESELMRAVFMAELINILV